MEATRIVRHADCDARGSWLKPEKKMRLALKLNELESESPASGDRASSVEPIAHRRLAPTTERSPLVRAIGAATVVDGNLMVAEQIDSDWLDIWHERAGDFDLLEVTARPGQPFERVDFANLRLYKRR